MSGKKSLEKNDDTNTQSRTFALAGNPNVGKSTLFNALTGLKQHTGNWSGKTVGHAVGTCRGNESELTLVDLPGTYSILSNSAEEEVARDFICFETLDGVIVVADATALERNLNLLFQILEITASVILCVNLIDEAAHKKITVDCEKLSAILKIPVIPTSAVKKADACKILNAAEKLPLAYQNGQELPERFLTRYDDIIEQCAALLIPPIQKLTAAREKFNLNPRFIALKLICGEETLIKKIDTYCGAALLSDPELSAARQEAQAILNSEGYDTAKIQKSVVSAIVRAAEEVANETVAFENPDYAARDRRIDKILTSKKFGFPIMLLALGIIFLITILLANYPSALLAYVFGWLETKLNGLFSLCGAPYWIQGPIMDGIYKTTAWVVAVMLPPMAIFFPLFTLLEDLGYLPRVAFNLDHSFKKCGCSGKQSLCMCMGFGCNAAGVVGARIIDSPRERTIAILTNNFVPCNGRFPTLIAISTIFIGGAVANRFLSGLVSALALTLIVVTGIAATLLISKFLSKTFFKGMPSSFSLELPPYRKPQVGKILLRSLLDRTVFVLWRAVKISLPAGLIIWCLANVQAGGSPLIGYLNQFFQPLAWLMGLDGTILTAFVLGFPANEIVIPIALMNYTGSQTLLDFASLAELGSILKDAGWTVMTGINMLIFTLFHYPCATTCLTIKKETGSVKWTALAMLLPTVVGIAACAVFTGAFRLILLFL